MSWTYRGSEFDEELDPKRVMGFVYLITNTVTSRKYVGKKLFFFKGKKNTILKSGKKKKVKCLNESDWKDYYGSSAEFLKEVEEYGKENFTREILHLCTSKAEISYLEAYEQFSRHVLLDSDFANGWVMVRVRKEHLKRNAERIKESLNNQ